MRGAGGEGRPQLLNDFAQWVTKAAEGGKRGREGKEEGREGGRGGQFQQVVLALSLSRVTASICSHARAAHAINGAFSRAAAAGNRNWVWNLGRKEGRKRGREKKRLLQQREVTKLGYAEAS